MDTTSRHQCLIYEGSPSQQLLALATQARQKLRDNYRCLYLNTPSMVTGMRSYLALAGINVTQEIAKGSLVLTSEQNHLAGGHFDVDRMIRGLEEAVQLALADGYKGLWASGDMSWEFGPQKEFGKLLEYEWRLEEFFQREPALHGICQYHKESLPRQAMQDGLVSHPSIFINETLSRVNPHYLKTDSFAGRMEPVRPELDALLSLLCSAPSAA
jgi:hypothetical protein